jgi:uncharacterized protein (DUF2235 family)
MKHIIIGLDGTKNAAFADTFKTNVYRLGLALNYKDNTAAKNQQLVMYYPGVGTQTSRKLFSNFAIVTGDGIDLFILEAYINLVLNYEKNDKIYIFGFSRGAVAARALTGLISRSGIVKINSPWLINAAWSYFTDENYCSSDYDNERIENVHSNVEITFLGVWDTVSGPYKKAELFKRFRFKDLHLDKSVRNGVHIVSIDETRDDFRPMLWEKAPPNTGQKQIQTPLLRENESSNTDQKQLQIWMPGVHSDIGGGYKNTVLANISLLAMIDKFSEFCKDIDFDNDYIKRALIDVIKNNDIEINDEWTDYPFYPLGHINFLRKTCNRSPIENDLSHPITKMILQDQIKIRGEKGVYTPSATFTNMETVDFLSHSFSTACHVD